MMEYTVNGFIDNYNKLEKGEKGEKEQANQYIIGFQKSHKCWELSQQMLRMDLDSKYQFLAGQMISRKTRVDYVRMSKQDQNQLREFIFQYLFTSDDKPSLAQKQLTQAAAIMAVIKLLDDCPHFISDLINNCMGQSQANLILGLNIIENIPNEFEQMVIDKRSQIQIKQLLIENNSNNLNTLQQMFMSLLVNSSPPQIISLTLQCLLSWVQFKYQLLENQSLFIRLLELFELDSEFKYVNVISEIIVESINKSKSADLQLTTKIENVRKIFLKNSYDSLLKLIEFLTNYQQQKLLEQYAQYESVYLKGYIEIVVAIGNRTPIFIFENNEWSMKLMKLLVYLIQHQNMQYSMLIFEFFNSFKTIMKSIDCKVLQDNQYDFIFESYIQVLQIIIDKCYLRYIKPSIFQSDIDFTQSPKRKKALPLSNPLQENNNQELSEQINEFRNYAEDLFQNIFYVINEYRNENGVQLFFMQIDQRLKRQFYIDRNGENNPIILMDYLLGIESTIFSCNAILDHQLFQIFNHQIQSLLRRIIEELPYDDLVVKTSLNFIYNCSQQFKYDLNLTKDSFQYILKFILDKQLNVISSQCLLSITETIQHHNWVDIFKLLYQFMVSHLNSIDNEQVLENIVQAIFHLALQFQQTQHQMEAVQQSINIVQSMLTNLESKSYEINPIQFSQMVNIVISSLLTIDITDQEQCVLIQNIINPFLQQAIPILLQGFIKFISSDRVATDFTRLFKLIIKLQQEQIQNHLQDVINKTFTIFQHNISKNSMVLQVFGSLINILESSPCFSDWLYNNYDQISKLLIDSIYINQDPEIIQNFIKVQQNVVTSQLNLLVKSQYYNQILEIIMKSFCINEYNLHKELFSFFKTIFSSKIKSLIFILNDYLQIFFEVFPDISTSLILNAVQVFQIIFDKLSNQDQQINQMILQQLDNPKYQQLNQKDKKVIVDFIQQKNKDTPQLKLMFYDLTNFVNGKDTKEFLVNIEIKLKNLSLPKSHLY